ncbi:IQ motif and SEC7 domain-containing protein 3-like isoform X2 [Dermacentor silvarum]|uniref:IQ motif and SEC7 domain-containing protein 3-like isoform X2 n=1 Tax=Dermacentor silvarum TaxID=543639 RepID=UPI001899D478|nr:IQ motif and SEC7 domain-containing protein 3-like isoform X2 [Dermacentor silvarum]
MWMPPASRCDELLLLWRCLALQAGLAGPGSALRVCRDRPSFRRYPAVDRQPPELRPGPPQKQARPEDGVDGADQGGLPNRGSTPPRKAPPLRRLDDEALKRSRLHSNQYELSQDLLDKQVEMLERKYGGVRARTAALTIQRAFRSHCMQKRFLDLASASKGERRLSRRIHALDLLAPSGASPPSSEGALPWSAHHRTPTKGALAEAAAAAAAASRRVPPQVPRRSSSIPGTTTTTAASSKENSGSWKHSTVSLGITFLGCFCLVIALQTVLRSAKS